MNKNTWHVVTIQEEDGHVFDGIFITDDSEMVDMFVHAMDPLCVTCSRHRSEEKARDFFFEICDSFVNIDPLHYIDYARSHFCHRCNQGR